MVDGIKCCEQVEQGEDRQVAFIDCIQNVRQYFQHGRLSRVMCPAWRRITLPATVSWLPNLDGDLCDPLSDVSALCHVRTASSVIDPSRRLGRVHGIGCRSVYVTLHYR